MIRFLRIIFVVTVIGGCWDADPRSARGALDLASRAIEAGDGMQLFKVIDERARHAMISIVHDRREAARLVREGYPEALRSAALAALGDAAEVQDAAGLFARRCTTQCMAEIRETLGAPVEQRRLDGEAAGEIELRTSRGSTLRMFVGSDTWWGLVWRTRELSRERDRAAQELRQVRDNVQVYRRRRELEASAESAGRSSDQGSSPVAR